MLLSLHHKIFSGCSSARLEYTSGGRVVASSNLVIPTILSIRVLNRKIGDFFISIPTMLASNGV